jgi:hypothetical protein
MTFKSLEIADDRSIPPFSFPVMIFSTNFKRISTKPRKEQWMKNQIKSSNERIRSFSKN